MAAPYASAPPSTWGISGLRVSLPSTLSPPPPPSIHQHVEKPEGDAPSCTVASGVRRCGAHTTGSGWTVDSYDSVFRHITNPSRPDPMPAEQVCTPSSISSSIIVS